MEYAQLNEAGTEALQITTHGNVEWDANHFCPASALTPEEAVMFRVVPLEVTEPPTIDPLTQSVIHDGCEKVDGKWRYRWRVDDLTAEQKAAKIKELADNLRQELALAYEARMAVIATGYPPSERESWPVQTSEAYALVADPQASTPWIDAAASARGLDRLELAQRIAAKDAQYRVISGTLSGVRQRIEDQIDAAGDDQSALQAIDVTQGWPE